MMSLFTLHDQEQKRRTDHVPAMREVKQGLWVEETRNDAYEDSVRVSDLVIIVC